MTNSGVVDFIDNSGEWNDFTIVFATNWFWDARFQDLATSTGIGFVDCGFANWTRLNLALRLWNTFTNILKTWAFVISISVTCKFLFFDLGRASVTSDLFLQWARDIITAVLTCPSVAASIKTIFITKADSGTVLKILADSWNMFDSWSFTVDKNAGVLVASVFGSPFMTNWVFKTVVFANVFFTS